MSTQKPKQAGAESGAATGGSAPKDKGTRYHTISGIPYEVVRTYYDSHQNSVIDVFRKTKIVQNRRGEDVEVELYLKARCQNEELQKKYVRAEDIIQEITDVE